MTALAPWVVPSLIVGFVVVVLAICVMWALALIVAGLLKAITWPFRRYRGTHRS